MWDYTDKVKDLFLNPKNVGEVENADAVGEVGSLACGDALRLTLKIGKDGRITDAKFKTFGCASAIASSSILTEMIIGKTIEEASGITNKDIAQQLGGLPEQKMHCSVMGMEALEAAIQNFRGKPAEKMDAGEIVCKCFGVTDTRIRRVIRENKLETVDQITNYTKAGGGCGSCQDKIEIILKEELDRRAKEPLPAEEKKPPGRRMTNLQKINRIQEVIAKDIRPMLQQDGGNIELIDVDGSNVTVSLTGMCADCISSSMTIGWVQQKLREFVAEDIEVSKEEA
jgi:NifU-like protein